MFENIYPKKRIPTLHLVLDSGMDITYPYHHKIPFNS
jgi:hypothetical protein